jgi:hypothetical protein
MRVVQEFLKQWKLFEVHLVELGIALEAGFGVGYPVGKFNNQSLD